MIRTGATDAVTYTWTPLRPCVATARQASENRLVEVIQPETTRCVFTYAHQGRRRTKKTYSWDEQAEDWALDSERVFIYNVWNLAHELITDHTQSPAEESTKSYVWGLDLSQTLEGAGGVGGLLQTTLQDDTSFYTYDGNGNVVALVDADTAATVATYDYSSFGETISMSGSAAADNTFRFSTKYHDSETGLVYYGYRYYEPNLGRWMSRDPIGEKGGQNIYAFVDNSMVGEYDLLGLGWGPIPPIVAPAPSPSLPTPSPSPPSSPGSGGSGQRMRLGPNGWECRTSDQLAIPTPNGCGPAGWPTLPGGPGLWSLTAACNSHDICYGTCGADKTVCDTQFLADMTSICSAFLPWLPGTFASCMYQASVFYTAVATFGDTFFENSQDNFCRWEPCCP